ncbi:MAG: hypothetical protein QXM96_04260 [Candidatus Woesearchaeota archaeon]
MDRFNREEFKKKFQKYLNVRYLLFALIFLIAFLVWGKYVVGLALLAIFLPFTFFTIKYSKMIPNISIESNTAMTFFIGYVFGSKYGLIYGPIVGISCYALNSFISPGYILAPIVAGISAIFMGFFHFTLHLNFIQSFFLALVIRTILAFLIFIKLYDPVEVTMHQVTQFISNLVIYLPLLSLLYELIKGFV